MRLFIDPTVVLTSTKVDDLVVERLDPDPKSGASSSVHNDQFCLPFLFEVRPPNEFYYETAKGKLMDLRVGEQDGATIRFQVPGELASAAPQLDGGGIVGQQEQMLRLAGWINLESRITV